MTRSQSPLTLALGALPWAVALATGAAHADEIKTDGQWRGSAALSASVSSGNTESTNVAGNLDAYKATAADKWTVYGILLYGTSTIGSEDETTANNLRVGTRYDYNLGPRTFAFGLGEYAYDQIANIDSRLTAGTGLGYKVIQSETTTFNVMAGLAGTWVQFDPSGSDSALELLLSEESTHRITETVSFRQKLDVYPNLSDTGEFRSIFDARLLVGLGGRWSLQLGLQNRYSSIVPPGVDKSDTVFLAGLNMSFGAD